MVKPIQNYRWRAATRRYERLTRQIPIPRQPRSANVTLLSLRARYYDSSTGVFCSQDPLEYVDGMSLYRGYFDLAGQDPLGLLSDFPQWTQATVVVKSFIDFMFKAFGEMPTAAATRRLTFFAAFTAANFREHPVTDAKDGEYRLYTRFDFAWGCNCTNELTGFKQLNGDKDGGMEPGGFQGTININGARVYRTGRSTAEMTWFVYGRPDLRAEPSFQWVWNRTSLHIWHEPTIEIGCPFFIRVKNFRNSDFPSHKVWVDGDEAAYSRQGSISSLWRGSRRQGVQLVTESGNGLFWGDPRDGH